MATPSAFSSIQDYLSSKLNISSMIGTMGNNNPKVAQAQGAQQLLQPNSTDTSKKGNVSTQLTGYTTYAYPEDLGNLRYPYYMVFYINAQAQAELTSNVSGNASQQQAAQSNKVNNAVTTNLQSNPNAVTNTFVNPTKRTVIALALPMPTELSMDSDAEYSTVSPGVLGSNLEAVMNGEILQTVKNIGQSLINDLPKFLGNIADETMGSSGAGEQMKQLAMKVNGRAVNERKEQIFRGMNSRKFSFNWTLVPRTKDESDAIHNIIYWLRYNQHPEIDVSSSGNTHGLNVIIPNEFDIEFHFQGNQMEGIPKISTCYLDSVKTNFTPLGKWIAFDGTDNPVATHLTLSFTEIEPLTRTQIQNGY